MLYWSVLWTPNGQTPAQVAAYMTNIPLYGAVTGDKLGRRYMQQRIHVLVRCGSSISLEPRGPQRSKAADHPCHLSVRYTNRYKRSVAGDESDKRIFREALATIPIHWSRSQSWCTRPLFSLSTTRDGGSHYQTPQRSSV
jgi:hypothetical protein